MIGILGLGIESTSFYTSYLQQKYYEKYGDYHTCPYLKYQFDFDELNQFLPDSFKVLVPKLQEIVNQLKVLPPKKWIIPNITLHETFDRLSHKIEIYHPLQIALRYCQLKNVKRIVVFGTKYTMNNPYLKSFFQKVNIEVISPNEIDCDFIDTLRKKVYKKTNNEQDLKNYYSIIQKYCTQNYILVSCTELSLLTPKINTDKIIDLAILQLDEAFKDIICN